MAHYYVATAENGGDNDNPGTVLEPWLTFAYADTQISPDDTVHIRGGTYTETIALATNGSSGNIITWRNYESESPIIQELAAPPTSSSHIYLPRVKITGNYVHFLGFEVRNSEGRGIELFEAIRSEVHDCLVHHIWNEGIIVDGNYGADSYAIIDGCTVHHAGLIYYHGSENWPVALIFVNGDECIVRGNVVYNNYGEGIGILRAGEALVEDNEVYDNTAVEVYLDNAADILVQRNLVYHTGDEDFDSEWGGIALDDEAYGNPRTGQRRTIINNIVIGCGDNFHSWATGNHALIDDIIAGNTFVNAGTGATGGNTGIKIEASNNHSNSKIKNNVIIQTTGTLADVPDDAEIDLDYNNWWNDDSNLPEADAQGAHDINENPDLVDHDHALTPGAVDPNWYKLTQPSPCRGAGVAVTEVTEDHWKTARSDPPDVGAHEYQRSGIIIMTL